MVVALILLIVCLFVMIKILQYLLDGTIASVVHKSLNADFPGYYACLTGYVALLVGIIITALVQSSSVVSSTLTPLVGLDIITLDRVFPMLLGCNIGTTSTAILASFTATGDRIKPSFQLALCHLFFNLIGFLIWYPIPFMRKRPLNLANSLGSTAAKYRWFAVCYVLCVFFIIPLLTFALSLPGWQVLAGVGIPILLLLITIALFNILQTHRPNWLPSVWRSWDFLPVCLRSLEPMDTLIHKLCPCRKHCCKDKPIQLIAEQNPHAERNILQTTEVIDPSIYRNGKSGYSNTAFMNGSLTNISIISGNIINTTHTPIRQTVNRHSFESAV